MFPVPPAARATTPPLVAIAMSVLVPPACDVLVNKHFSGQGKIELTSTQIHSGSTSPFTGTESPFVWRVPFVSVLDFSTVEPSEIFWNATVQIVLPVDPPKLNLGWGMLEL